MKSIIIGIACIGIICLIVFFTQLPNSWSLSLLSIPIFLTISECRKVSSFKAKGEYNIRKKCNCSKDCYCGGLFGINLFTGNTNTGDDTKEKPDNKEGDGIFFGIFDSFWTGNAYTGDDTKEKPDNKEETDNKEKPDNKEETDKKPEPDNKEGDDNKEKPDNKEGYGKKPETVNEKGNDKKPEPDNEEETKQTNISKLPLSSYIPPKLVTEYKEFIQKQNSEVPKKPTAFDDFMLIQQPLTE